WGPASHNAPASLAYRCAQLGRRPPPYTASLPPHHMTNHTHPCVWPPRRHACQSCHLQATAPPGEYPRSSGTGLLRAGRHPRCCGSPVHLIFSSPPPDRGERGLRKSAFFVGAVSDQRTTTMHDIRAPPVNTT